MQIHTHFAHKHKNPVIRLSGKKKVAEKHSVDAELVITEVADWLC